MSRKLNDATIATTGFGSVSHPKEVMIKLAGSTRDLSLSIVNGGSVGEETDTGLIEKGAIARRYPIRLPLQTIYSRTINARWL